MAVHTALLAPLDIQRTIYPENDCMPASFAVLAAAMLNYVNRIIGSTEILGNDE